jgi:hypothetical protein
MDASLADAAYVGDLGNGLICRWSTLADQAEIGRLMGTIWRGKDGALNPRPVDVARVLMNSGFPYMGAGDFAVVVDTSRPESPVVAYTCLWRLQWSFGGIPITVGQPEMVGTDPAYRNRGLVRALFAMVHARSAAEGHLVQAITGIPYFYRQFGYEYVLDLDGRRVVPLAALPEPPGADAAKLHLRPAALDDIPQLMALYDLPRPDSLVWHVATEDFWRHHIASWDDPFVREGGPTRVALNARLHMIVDEAGATAGYCGLAAKRWDKDLEVFALQLDAHVNWAAASPALLRAFCDYAQQLPAVKDDLKPFSEISFNLGRSHPIYDVLGQGVASVYDPPYAWYLRVPDVPAFIRHIAPVLEARLAKSIATAFTGDLCIDMYNSGLRLQFDRGKLAAVEPWRAPALGDDAHAGCPPLVFLQLLFGYRSLAELRAFFPDVWANQDGTLLINALFPAQPSVVHPLSNV